MKTALLNGLMAMTVAAGLGLCLYSATGDEKPATAKIFELRTYKTHPGKLTALHARFRDHTCKLSRNTALSWLVSGLPQKATKRLTR